MNIISSEFGDIELYQGYPVSLTSQQLIPISKALEVQSFLSELLNMPVRLFGAISTNGPSITYRLLHAHSVIHYMSKQSVHPASMPNYKTPLSDSRKVRMVGLWDGKDVRDLLSLFNQTRDQMSIRDRIVKRYAMALQSRRIDEDLAKKFDLKLADYQRLIYFIDDSGRTIFFPSEDKRFRQSALAVYCPDIENAIRAISLFKLNPGETCEGELPKKSENTLFTPILSAKGITSTKLGVQYE